MADKLHIFHMKKYPASASSHHDSESETSSTSSFCQNDDVSRSYGQKRGSGNMDLSQKGRGISRSRKRIPPPPARLTQGHCVVCEDNASGYHYNALTCEGCKSFFRRSVVNRANYKCKWSNECVYVMDMYMRRKCPACRLKKCINVGMKPEFVVVPKNQGFCTSTESSDTDTVSSSTTTDENDEEPGTHRLEPVHDSPPTFFLSADDTELIGLLMLFQKELELPTEEQALFWNEKTVQDIFRGDSMKNEEEASEVHFRHVTEITILTVRLIVEYSKRLKGFDTLLVEDKTKLLTANSSEVMMLRAARRYDYKTDTILFANERRYTRENYNEAHIGDTADPLFDFCGRMCRLHVDDAQFALLTSIVIFSDCPGLKEPNKVEEVQEIYLRALRNYVHQIQPSAPAVHFAKLLAVLPELRTLGFINSELCVSLKRNNKNLPPLLENIWIDPKQFNTEKSTDPSSNKFSS